MKNSKWLMVVVAAVALAPLPACSSDNSLVLYITSFGADKSIQEGLNITVPVVLNTCPETVTYVTVKNDYTANVEVNYGNQQDNNIVIRYNAGNVDGKCSAGGQFKQNVTVKGTKETAGTVPIVFSIRDGNDTQTLKVSVNKYIVPDFGVLPDTGPVEAGAVEASVTEAGVKEASVTEASVTEAGATKEASTPDATRTQ